MLGRPPSFSAPINPSPTQRSQRLSHLKSVPSLLVLPLGRIVTHHSSSFSRGSPLISFRSFLGVSSSARLPHLKWTLHHPPSIHTPFFFVSSSHCKLICLVMFFSLAFGLHEGGDLACHSLCCLQKPEKPLAGNSLLINTREWVDEWMLLRQYRSGGTESKEHLNWFTVLVPLPSTDSDTSLTLKSLWDE